MTLQKLNDLDQDLSKKISFAEQPGLVRNIAVFLGHTGDSWFWAVALLLIWAFAPEAYASWAWVTLLAVVVTAALVLGIKFTIRRQRPAGELGQIYRKTAGNFTRSNRLRFSACMAWHPADHLGTVGRDCANRHGGPLSLGCTRRVGIGSDHRALRTPIF